MSLAQMDTVHCFFCGEAVRDALTCKGCRQNFLELFGRPEWSLS